MRKNRRDSRPVLSAQRAIRRRSGHSAPSKSSRWHRKTTACGYERGAGHRLWCSRFEAFGGAGSGEGAAERTMGTCAPAAGGSSARGAADTSAIARRTSVRLVHAASRSPSDTNAAPRATGRGARGRSRSSGAPQLESNSRSNSERARAARSADAAQARHIATCAALAPRARFSLPVAGRVQVDRELSGRVTLGAGGSQVQLLESSRRRIDCRRAGRALEHRN